MGDKVSTGHSISSGSSSSEVDVFACVLDGDLINDVRAVAGSSPLDSLVQKEEEDEQEKQLTDAKKEVVSGLLSFLHKPVRDYLVSPQELVTRVYVLTYLLNPSLINSMSLAELGKILGEASGIPAISR